MPDFDRLNDWTFRNLVVAWPSWVLAVVVTISVSLLGAGPASATTLPEVQTRVGASTPAAQVVVGVAEHITAGQHQGNAPPQADATAGSCVAAKTGAELGDDVVLVRGGTNAADRLPVGAV